MSENEKYDKFKAAQNKSAKIEISSENGKLKVIEVQGTGIALLGLYGTLTGALLEKLPKPFVEAGFYSGIAAYDKSHHSEKKEDEKSE